MCKKKSSNEKQKTMENDFLNDEINLDSLRKKHAIKESLTTVIVVIMWILGIIGFIWLYIYLDKSQDPIRHFLIFLYIFAIGLVILITFSFMLLMTLKRGEERINEMQILLKDLPENYKIEIKYLIDKKYDYIRNYLLFQVTHKVLGILSIVYSVLGLFTLLTGQIDLTKATEAKSITFIICLIPFSAIVCVLVTLYVAQPSRVSQYLDSWRRCNELILHTISKLYDAEEYYRILKKQEYNFTKNCANSCNENSASVYNLVVPNKQSNDEDKTEENPKDNNSVKQANDSDDTSESEKESESNKEVEINSKKDKYDEALDFFRKQNTLIASTLSDIEFKLSSDSE